MEGIYILATSYTFIHPPAFLSSSGFLLANFVLDGFSEKV
jgi:hypothetical protein